MLKCFIPRDNKKNSWDKQEQMNCGLCARYDWNESKCNMKEAERYAEWDKEHGWSERMMQQNRGVRIE